MTETPPQHTVPVAIESLLSRTQPEDVGIRMTFSEIALLDAPWQAALSKSGMQFSESKLFIFVPAWKGGKRHRSEEKPRLLIDQEDRLSIIERSRQLAMIS